MRGNQFDILLLKLATPLTLSQDVNVVCLPSAVFPPGTKCVAAGWGADESDRKHHTVFFICKVPNRIVTCNAVLAYYIVGLSTEVLCLPVDFSAGTIY